MDLSFIIRQLRAAGAVVEIPEHSEADLRVNGHLVELKTFHRDPTPSDVLRMRNRAVHDAGPLLVWVHSISPALADLAVRERRVIVVGDNEVIYNGQHVALVHGEIQAKSKPGPRPYARFAVGRALLAAGRNSTQQTLATRAGVSQGTVSQTVQEWRDTVNDGELFDRLVAEYPGPGGIETFWWSDAPVREQADDLRRSDALISGDLAASEINGWRMPERAIGYSRRQFDLAPRGYVLATSLDYTLRLVVPLDPTLWATAESFGRAGVADPVIAAYDVLRTATTGDQDEAVAKLREAATRD